MKIGQATSIVLLENPQIVIVIEGLYFEGDSFLIMRRDV